VKIKTDENLPAALARHLCDLGHDVDTVWDEGLQGRNDGQIWQAAQAEGRFLITQDLDFSDIRRFAPGSHHGLLLVRLRDPGRLALTQAVREAFATQDITGWQGCFIVLTENKIRVLRPES
jgi:predicted nuclease of predicted toxin-antitoxin system